MRETRGPALRQGLVVGFGNPLRADDGVGAAVVERLNVEPSLSTALRRGSLRVFWTHQLTPELSADFAAADIVILVDADAGLAPGVVREQLVDVASAAMAGPGMTHHVDAASLAAMARDLFDGSPEVWVVGVGPESTEVGETLTPAVAAAVPAAADAAIRLLGDGFRR
jgi:hydrogenase maturation protease